MAFEKPRERERDRDRDRDTHTHTHTKHCRLYSYKIISLSNRSYTVIKVSFIPEWQ